MLKFSTDNRQAEDMAGGKDHRVMLSFMLIEQKDFIEKGCLGREQEGKGTQENCSVAWLTASGFMVMGLVSGLSLANHYNSESFLVVHTLLSQDGC